MQPTPDGHSQRPVPARPLDYGRSASQYAAQNDYIPPCPGNPFVTIFTEPRDTLSWIIGTNPKLHVVPIMIVSAILNAIDSAFDEKQNLSGAALIGALVLGIPIVIALTLLFFFLYGWLLKVIGGWFGGTGDSERCRAALAWGQIPSLACGIVLTPIIVLVALTGIGAGTINPIVVGVAMISLAFSIYSLVLMSIGVGVAHRFTAWLGFAALVLAAIFIVLALLALIMPIVFLLM